MFEQRLDKYMRETDPERSSKEAGTADKEMILAELSGINSRLAVSRLQHARLPFPHS